MIKRRGEAGQTIYIVAAGLFALIGAAGLAVDIGYLRYEKRLIQSAADSAALAAATDVNLADIGINQTAVTDDALAAAESNGFQTGPLLPNNTVTVSASGIAPANAVQVTVQEVLPSFFMNVVGLSSSTISAKAVATVGTSNGCIYALQAGGLTLNAGIDAPNCGIVDNGTLTGGGDTTTESVGVFGAAAGYTGVPAPETIAQPAADPLGYLTPPTPSACTTPLTVTSTVTLTEGTYCGIIINTGGNVTFSSGLYILTGNTGLQVTGTGIAAGTGLTFYNSGTGSVTFNGTGGIALSAPTAAEVSGDPSFGSLPPGILFYQDPGDTSGADVSEGGSGNVTLSGTLYFPTALITVAGSLNPNANTLVVAGSVTVSGSVLLNADSTSASLPGGSPLRTVTLVE